MQNGRRNRDCFVMNRNDSAMKRDSEEFIVKSRNGQM